MSSDELHYKLYKQLEENPQQSQRELAEALDISLGKANYCLKALVKKGLVKAKNFRSSHNKLAYMYLLTPKGIEEKASLTKRFLQHKIEEYELLKKQIVELRQEAEQNDIAIQEGE